MMNHSVPVDEIDESGVLRVQPMDQAGSHLRSCGNQFITRLVRIQDYNH